MRTKKVHQCHIVFDSRFLFLCQPERGTKRKKGGKDDNETDSKKRPITADISTGSGLSEEERLKILEMVENEPEVSGHQTSWYNYFWDSTRGVIDCTVP